MWNTIPANGNGEPDSVSLLGLLTVCSITHAPSTHSDTLKMEVEVSSENVYP